MHRCTCRILGRKEEEERERERKYNKNSNFHFHQNHFSMANLVLFSVGFFFSLVRSATNKAALNQSEFISIHRSFTCILLCNNVNDEGSRVGMLPTNKKSTHTHTHIIHIKQNFVLQCVSVTIFFILPHKTNSAKKNTTIDKSSHSQSIAAFFHNSTMLQRKKERNYYYENDKISSYSKNHLTLHK